MVFTSCIEVWAAGAAPLHRGDPGFSAALDVNGDGVACELAGGAPVPGL
ncbi:excalibur calcium-binding domain-containing protein [Kribbella turkmenica]|nr:excalibur calcium-binding domain-containing protein [Kribbella turkmenica]